MKYYKHSQLVKEYSVSDRTVRNWVEASLEGKVDLKLYENKGRYYIANSLANQPILESLAQHGKKYRNSRSSKTVEPKPEFYEFFTLPQVADITNSLEKDHELPWHYSYVGEAADYWDDYLMELHSAGKGNLITNTIDTIRLNYPYLEAMIEPYDHVNVINVCVGNNIAVHDLLSRIRSTGKLKRFIAADISSDMLDIAERNVHRWFDGTVKMERQVLDIRYQKPDVISGEASADGKTLNIFTMVAGPLKNFMDPQRVLQTLNASMGKDDLLITTIKRDTPQTRGFFDFNVKSDKSLLGFSGKYLLDVLNIDESYYEAEQTQDGAQRRTSIKLKVNLTLHFMLAGSLKTIEFEKGETILLWRAHNLPDDTVSNLLNGAGFEGLLTAQSLDKQLLLSISQPKVTSSRRP